MEFREFIKQAALTDVSADKDRGTQLALYGVASEAGSVVAQAKKLLRTESSKTDVWKAAVQEEIGDLLWYIISLARHLDIDLHEVMEQNLDKVHSLWATDLPPLPSYDDHAYPNQKLLRNMMVRFDETETNNLRKVRVVALGELAQRVRERASQRPNSVLLGDILNNNSVEDDGYCYHDVIHLAHAAVLGWSPVIRAFSGRKRKSLTDYDLTQDGARAVAIEEGLAAFVFNYLEPYDFDSEAIDWTLHQHIRNTVRNLEVADQPFAAWRHAYQQAFSVFKLLRQHRGGFVKCDLNRRSITFIPLNNHSSDI